jgi:protein involved in polysaccharide export with SLBB domain
LSDAVHLAGGLAPDAQTEDAQVFRYLPDGKVRIFSVNLEQALAGDSSENILMQPRDRLLVHRNPDAVEPATVNVQGEVAKPGRYPLTTNMQVGDLIRVGGGLTPSAETQTADLTHYQWVGNGQAANGAANPTSAPNQLTAKHETIAITAALAGDPKADVALHNGDVLTIGQLPGWNDLGASIRVKGEVANPGTYGIRPGERLSSIIERAGGFQSDAYPYGAVLQRTQVRELEAKGQNEMILRVQDAQTTLQLLPDADPKAKQAKEMALQQWQTSLELLNSNPPLGRVTIRISSNVDHWKDTNADINVRAGDTLLIPKRPSFVMVTGQVFNPTAVSFRPGKSAKWYLSQSGGPTQLANKKAIFVIRADGSVIGSSSSAWAGDSMSRVLEPGDTLVVPERALGGGVQWQSVFLAAQTAASVASAIIIAVRF